MKKKLLAALIGITLSGAAFAGTYSDSAEAIKKCDTAAYVATHYHNQPKSEREKLIVEGENRINTFNANQGAAAAIVLYESYFLTQMNLYAMKSKESAKHVHMTVWARCMDHYTKQ